MSSARANLVRGTGGRRRRSLKPPASRGGGGQEASCSRACERPASRSRSFRPFMFRRPLVATSSQMRERLWRRNRAEMQEVTIPVEFSHGQSYRWVGEWCFFIPNPPKTLINHPTHDPTHQGNGAIQAGIQHPESYHVLMYPIRILMYGTRYSLARRRSSTSPNAWAPPPSGHPSNARPPAPPRDGRLPCDGSVAAQDG
jgi:hypothetical protein